MRFLSALFGVLAALVVIAGGVLVFPYAFADRITTPLTITGEPLFGLQYEDLPSLLSEQGRQLSAQAVPVEFRGHTQSTTLEKLGVELNIPATVRIVQEQPMAWDFRERHVQPQFILDQARARQEVEALFKNVIKPAKNASLAVSAAGNIQLVKGKDGEAIDSAALAEALRMHFKEESRRPVPLRIVSAAPRIQDHEVEHARALVTKLMADGLALTFEDRTFVVTKQELQRLIEFGEQVDPQDPQNYILGVRLHPQRLRQRLTQLAEELDQEPVNAKFEISQNEGEDARVTQFAAPERGLALNIDATASKIAQAITVGTPSVPLTVDITEPVIAEHTDLKNLGIIGLIAKGESSFAGSPRNRVHNILVGASRYNGLLIAPGEEFSFNQHLGPVNAAAGFKPELVIKAHATVPEFGGGLCQVSTTAFRAAVYSGLEITERKNHAYAVRYYGKAGFDATIYPGYTNLRFRNNTPGHILIQTKVEGTQLTFEFWGTPDGREVQVEGPNPYQRRPDGAVKATLTQRVLKDGQTLFEKTFYSNYRSPNLYPKVLAANAQQPSPTFTPSPIEGPIPPPAPPGNS